MSWGCGLGLWVGAVGWRVGAVAGRGCGLEGWGCGLGLWGSESVCVKSDQPVLTSVGTMCHCRSLSSDGQHRMTFVIYTKICTTHGFGGAHVLCQFESVYIKSDVP